MSTREILEELVRTSVAKKGTGYIDFDMAIKYAHSAIISLILEKMPKENYDIKITPIELDNQEASAYLQGFNSALAEMRERIKKLLPFTGIDGEND